MKKKIIIVLCLVLICLGCVGCSYDQDKVRLHSKLEAQSIVRRRYGKAEYLGKNTIHEYKIEYTFRDKHYGFVYHFYSFSEQFCLDGSCGMYYRRKTTDYHLAFMKYIFEKHQDEIDEIIQKYNVEISIADGSITDQVVYISQYPYDYEKVKPAIEELKNIIQETDEKQFYKGYYICIKYYDETGTKLLNGSAEINIWDEE